MELQQTAYAHTYLCLPSTRTLDLPPKRPGESLNDLTGNFWRQTGMDQRSAEQWDYAKPLTHKCTCAIHARKDACHKDRDTSH